MKRAGRILLALGTFCIAGSIVFVVLVELTSVRTIFLKSFITDVLEEKGYEVFWEKSSTVEAFRVAKTMQPNLEWPIVKQFAFQRQVSSYLQQAQLLHLVEVTEEDVLLLYPEQTLSSAECTAALSTGQSKIHFHEGKCFRWSAGKGIRPWPDGPTPYWIFSIPEMANIDERIQQVVVKGLVYGSLPGTGFLLAGAGMIVLARVPPQVERKRPARVRTQPEQVPAFRANANSGPSTGSIQRQPEPDWLSLSQLIARDIAFLSLGDQRTRLEERFAEIESGDPRAQIPRGNRLLLDVQGARSTEQAGGSALHASPAEGSVSSGELDVDGLLPIDEFIPSDLDPATVKNLLLWGFLRPGVRTAVFNQGYRASENIVQSVRRKYPLENVTGCMDWLMDIGVVIIPTKKGGQHLCSLNAHPASATYPADEIIRVLILARRELTKRVQ